jgi:hypothetical protein
MCLNISVEAEIVISFSLQAYDALAILIEDCIDTELQHTTYRCIIWAVEDITKIIHC